MKRVPIINNDIVDVWIDDEDFNLINKYKWTYHLDRKGYPHIESHQTLDRLIMGNPNPKEFWVDHINKDRNNNTRKNLRLATIQQNNWNKRKHKDATKSKYIHVRPARKNKGIEIPGVFVTEITMNNHSLQIGRFNCEIKAAQAANIAMTHLRKEFASLNSVDEPTEEFKQEIIGRITNLQKKYS